MRFERIPIEKVNPAPYNPRQDLQPGDPAYEKIRRSLEEFGCVEPLVWNKRTGNLVGGHQRLKVLQAQGAREVEVSVVDLPPERERALNLALNKIAGDWDEEKLAHLLDELAQTSEVDLELTGFEGPELESLLEASQGSLGEESFDLEAALDQVGKPVTQEGELIELGPHRLLCGDSAKREDIKLLMGSCRADVVFTDPPYNVSYYGGNRPQPAKARPKPSRNWARIYGDDMTQEAYETWLSSVLWNVDSVLGPGAPLYLWNGHRQFGPMHLILTRMGYRVGCVLTWAKESFSIGYGDYNQQTEFCLYAWKLGSRHRWYGPTNETTLWQVAREHTQHYLHPTQKPVELAERALRNSSRRGDIVLDVFLGSGTTLVAAERLGRRCFGIEIDPKYCDVVIRRYIALAGDGNVPAGLAERYRLTAEGAAL